MKKSHLTLAPVNVRSCSCAFKSLFICRSNRAYMYTQYKSTYNINLWT